MKLLPRRNQPSSAEDHAVYWQARKSLQQMTWRDDALFEAWLASPENKKAWDELEDISALLGTYAAHPEIRRMRDTALQKTARGPRFENWPWGKVAAAAATFLVLAGAGITTVRQLATDPSIRSHDRVAQFFATGVHERRDVLLPDGSQLTLNTNSIVRVAYRADRREIRLVSGQALFKVAKDASRPFDVFARGERVRAIGTQFDVEMAPNGTVKILLVEGHVAVADDTPATTDITMRRSGQRLSVNADGSKTLDMTDVGRSLSWTRGELIFRNDSAASAAAQINRYSPLQIMMGSPDIAKLPVSGVFRTDRPEDFIDAMVALYPLRAEQISDRVIRLSWKSSHSARQPSRI
ncbi:MAG: FecR domain-containing protein [Sphingobium sp.]